MKIIVAMTQAPFIVGGAEYLSKNLVVALKSAGHEVEQVNIPMMDSPIEILENQIVAARLLEVERTWAGNSDLCIGLKFPAYFIKHSNKVVWALHQHRAAYDLWGKDYTDMHLQSEGNRMRNVIHNADNLYLREAKRIYTISENVAQRMKRYNNLAASCLYHPCPDMEKFYCGEYENYILMPSRINVTKRQRLAVEALKHSKTNMKLYFVGKADNIAVADELHKLVEENNLADRIKFFDFVTQEEKLKLYANARAVMFIPFDEDYGYITLEGMSARKAIITTTDSGGPLEFVSHGKSGLVVDPAPEELARAIDAFATSEQGAKEMGENAKKRLGEMNISWENVVEELTR